MTNDILTNENELITTLSNSIEYTIGNIKKLEKTIKPTFGGERFLTDHELSIRLKINRRTLHEYRNQGKLPFIRLGGKLLYRESDIEKLLNDNYHRSRD